VADDVRAVRSELDLRQDAAPAQPPTQDALLPKHADERVGQHVADLGSEDDVAGRVARLDFHAR
jgi:hypothetical protein